MDVEDLYGELILDHHQQPRNRRCIEDPDCKECLLNPLCGDRVQIYVTYEDSCIKDIAFEGKGCALSQASASMMTELLQAKPLTEVQKISSLFFQLIRGEVSGSDAEDLGDAIAFEGVQRIAARQKCVLLAWEALEQCLNKEQTS